MNSDQRVFRLFVAAELGVQPRAALARLVSQLARLPARMKWVQPDAIHITLFFLGDVFAARVADLAPALDAAAVLAPPLRCTVCGLGAFGRLDSPRVIWAGIGEGAGALARLQRRVAAACEALGFPPEERAWTPHITIGRSRSSTGIRSVVEALEKHREDVFGESLISRIVLMRSTLRPEGPEYTILHASPLAAA